MTQAALDFTPTPKTLKAKVLALLQARPNTWIDGLEIAMVGGRYAWRSRLSDLRQKGHVIENRTRRVKTLTGQTVTISEYRYRPPSA